MFFIFHVCVAINVVLYIIYCHDESNYLQNKLKSFFHHQFGVIIDNNNKYLYISNCIFKNLSLFFFINT